MRLLIAEDNPKLLRSLVHIFETNQYTVDGVTNGADALSYAQSDSYDGLILDVMMPELDGVSVLRKLRAMNVNTPALFLTARTEVSQRIEGLDAGADDYLPKPFSTGELLARVRAMLRRKEHYTSDLLTVGDLTLDRTTYRILRDDQAQVLSRKEYQLMEVFMLNPGIILTTEKLLTHVWGWDTDVDTSVLWVHISNLRKKIDALGTKTVIRYVRGAGYLLEGPV